MIFSTLVHTSGAVVTQALIGGLVILLGAILGWKAARRPDGWEVRAIDFWIAHVVRRLLTSRSWSRRAAAIAANNATICAAMTAIGALGHAAWLGIAAVGFSLGVGLRSLTASATCESPPHTPVAGRRRAVGIVGFALNMLEPPAILLSAGLALAQGALPADVRTADVWLTFALLVLPLLLVAAAGESLWMSVWPAVRAPS